MEANCGSFVAILERFRELHRGERFPVEVWAVGSEIECHPAWGDPDLRIYLDSKRAYARRARHYFHDRSFIYRHIVPSAFTYTTGSAHWETLLRARAIENLAWVLAPAQGGRHASGRRTWGHSMIVDPWGAILAERSEEGPGVVVADLDPAVQARARGSLPALQHRRL